MRDIWKATTEWIDNGKEFAIARVIRAWRSAPRIPGASMIIDKEMGIAGSVSGGCVESSVIEEALQTLKDTKQRRRSYGVENSGTFSVGLPCGGEISVLIEKHWAFSKQKEFAAVWKKLRETLDNNEPAIFLSPIESEEDSPFLVLPESGTVGKWKGSLNHAEKCAMEAYRKGESGLYEIEGREVFVHVFPRLDKLLIIGAGHIAIPLVQFAKNLNFQTTVIDPRKIFSQKNRFPSEPDRLISQWPQDVLKSEPLHENTYAVLLTHEPRFDDPSLEILLNHHNLPYIGALGSKQTHADRCSRLEKNGISKEKIRKIRGPVGLNIGALTPAEIALSIMGEIIAVKRDRTRSV